MNKPDTTLVMTKHVAMPEFIGRNDIDPRSWSVQEGAPVRGDAWTEMRTATMRVPFGDDETSRVVRAHELTHAKISPVTRESLNYVIEHDKVDYETLISAEEFRVNMVVKHLGFNIDHLRDGSEVRAGEITGSTRNWNAMVRMVASSAGSKACNDFIRGLNKSAPDFAQNAKELQKVLIKKHKALLRSANRNVADAYSYICSTYTDSNQIPVGFTYHTVEIAKFLQKMMLSENTGPGDDDVEATEEDLPNAQDLFNGAAGRFADVSEEILPKPVHVNGRLGRRRVATNIGKNPRRINRMLVDPERRIFDRRAKGKGGIVLIDQSGSMHLTSDDIWKIIENAPGCLIIGYSHRGPRKPNLWVIADRGKVANKLPDGGGGNGVDGPAIKFALARRRNNEAFVWVCDGIVTDGDDDMYYRNLGNECARLVAKHGIHMVPNMDEAIKAFKNLALGRRLDTKFYGNVHTQALELGLVA